jgi:hypothetical protein
VFLKKAIPDKFTCAKPAKKRLERVKRRATAQQKTIKTFLTIHYRRCTIRVDDEAGNVIDTHGQAGQFKEW